MVAGTVRAGAPTGGFAELARRRPRLRDTVRVYRHRYRGQRWYVLHDTASGRWQRVNAEAWQFLRLLDGERSLGEAAACAAPALEEARIPGLVESLHLAELLDWEAVENAERVQARAARERHQRRLQRLLSPLAMRFALGDPDALLAQFPGLARRLFSRAALIAVALLVALGAAATVAQWPVVVGYWSARGYATHAVVLLPAVWIVMKLAHECAHALAVKRWGGEVHEAGIILLLLLPMPYVDASAAWGFADKHRRIAVGAAGILAEVSIAALAALVFLAVETGLVRDLAYTAMLLGTVSTIAFNANPLLRFDGYYVLSDAIEIPNLASRSARYWTYLVRRYAFGLGEASSPVLAPGERAWFVGYGAASTVYRVAIVLAIALLVAGAVPALGIALAVWVLVGQIGWPLLRGARYVLGAPALEGRRRRALAITAGAGALTVVVMLAVPLPLTTHAEGVVWLPEHGHVRSGASGTVAALLANPGTEVERGAPVLRLENPTLTARIAALRWERDESRARRSAARVDDPLAVQVIDAALTRLEADLAALREEADALTVTSPASGRLVIPDAATLTGQWVRKGAVVAYVLEHEAPVVRVALPQSDGARVREDVRAVSVRLVHEPRRTIPAALRTAVPAATHTLPSPALGARGGGRITVDAADPEGLTAVERLFVVDVALEGEPPPARVGGRAIVRFEHPGEPLGYRVLRAVRQLLLTRLAV